jgi:hypothetical protein
MEDTNIVSTSTADDWDSIDLSDVSDNDFDDMEDEATEETAEEEKPDTEEENPADHSEEETEEKPEEQPTETEEKKEADQSFTLKYMGEEKQFSRDETIALAQKGMDYDRVRTKLAEASEMVEFVNSLAKDMNMSAADFMNNALAGNIAKREGIPHEEALRRLELDKREKAISAKEAEAAAQSAQQAEADQRREKIRAELNEFANTFPNVKAEDIPVEVYQNIKKMGISLTTAYALYEAKQAKVALETEKQNAENKARAVGSASTSGKRKSADAFDDAWYDGT